MSKTSAQSKSVVFYFDREKYAETIKSYGRVINFAQDVQRELKKVGITPTLENICGFMQVHFENRPIKSEKQLLGVSEAYELKEQYYYTTPETEEEIKKFIEESVAPYPPTLREKYKESLENSVEKTKDSCYRLRSLWSKHIASIDYNALQYDAKEDSIMLKKEFIERIKSECNVTAESERAEKLYNKLCSVCEDLNEIKELSLNPDMILGVLRYDGEEFTLTPNTNYNYL